MVYSVLSEQDLMNVLIFADIYVLVITSLHYLLHGIVYFIQFTVHTVSHHIDIHIIYTIILHKSVCRRSQTAGRNSCSIVSVDVYN